MKKLLLVFLLIFMSLVSNAQLKEGVFRIAGGGGETYAASMIQTTDGGYAITGWTSSYGAGSWDVYMVKLDSYFNIEWTKTIGGNNIDVGNSITQTSDGGYVIVGYTGSYGAGNYDVYLIKLDSIGNVKWTRTVGGTGYDYGNSVVQAKDGGLVISGYTGSFGAGSYDVYVVKLDSVGNLKWTKTIGGTGDDEGNSITLTKDGGYAITGGTQSFGAGKEDVYVVKLDSLGNLKWTKTIGGTGDDAGNAIIQTNDNGYAITGQSDSYVGGGLDEYIVKLDSTSNLKYAKAIGNGYEEGNSIVQTLSGSIVSVGYTSEYTYSTGSSNAAYIVELDTSGNLASTEAIAVEYYTQGNSIVQTKDKGFAIAGTSIFGSDILMFKLDVGFNICVPTGVGGSIVSGGSVSSGGIVGTGGTITSKDSGRVSSGGTDSSLCSVLGINNIRPPENDVRIYPNPSNGVFSIQLKGNSEKLKIEVYNVLGEQVYSQFTINNAQFTIDLGVQPSDIYLYRITSEKGEYVASGKFVIQK